ncbi:MAG: EAL domain-containing protein [Acidimicrobiales bacterium]|jgi:diguanylate cyclase (GGDEF)-like protein/PAS domain S-box-containing protein
MTLDRSAEFDGLPAEFSAALLLAAGVVDSSEDAIVSQRFDGTIMSWNPAAERLYGWTAAEAIGQSEMIVPEARREEFSTVMTQLARGERVDHLETIRTRKDGSEVLVSVTVSPIYSSDGLAVGASCIAHDISGRQRSEQARAQLAAIVESAEDAIISVDLAGYVTCWNRGAERLYGYSDAEMVGRLYGEILEGEALEDFRLLFTRAASGEYLRHHETSRPRLDGTTIEVSVSVSPIFASDGSIVGVSAILHDITEHKQRERDLAESRALLEQAQRVGHIGGWISGVTPNAPLICTSETFRIFGTVERPNLTSADFFERVHPDDLPRVRAAVLLAIAHEGHYELEHRIVRPDGTQRWVFEAADVVADASGVPVKMAGFIQDITDRHEAEEKAQGVESQLRLLAENSRDLIFRYRIFPGPGFEFVSPASLAITGYAPDEFYAQPELIDRLIDPAARDLWLARVLSDRVKAAVDVELVRKDGSKIWVSQSLDAVRGATGEVAGINGITRDISERKAAELQLEHEVLHDPLTGLPNRVLLMDRIEHGLSRVAREHGLVAVLFVDLDRFKVFNDTRGHGWGDAVLIAVANRLVECSRAADTVGRFSGDEFVIVCEKLRFATDAIKIAAHMLNAFNAPFDIHGEEVHVTASIGIATGAAGESAEKLLRDADLAMYRAKELGRARYEVFDDTLRAEAERRSTAEAGLRRALDNYEFALVFQPVWSMTEERFVGAEALLRWHDPDRGIISPADFIPVAEECGLIVPIGEWVLEQACRSLARLTGSRQAACTMSVNVSAMQLRSRVFTHALEELIAATSIEPTLLCLEITESVLMEDVDFFSKVLHQLQATGTRLSIDDFGTGYSSLAYLRRFPVDELKIDRSFIANLDSDPYDATLVAAVIAIGDALGLRVVAEGVETTEELAALRDLGCQYAQGYLFARPCSFDEYVEYLKG